MLGTALGTVISLISIAAINAAGINFDFGRQSNLLLTPTIGAGDIISIVLIVIGIAVGRQYAAGFQGSPDGPHYRSAARITRRYRT